MRRQPALDGIRGLAIAAVVAFHADQHVFRGGHLGVTVFFVLSGYLITTLLLRDHAGETRLRIFYRRRVARLLPALVVNLALGSIVYAALGYSLAGVLPSLFYVANVHDILTANGPHTDPFFYCWSLSIEEQFYLVWPALLLVTMSRRPRMVPTIAILGIVWAVVERALIANTYPLHAAISTDTRMDSVLVGCLLAWTLHRVALRLAEPFAWAGIAALLVLVLVATQGPATYRDWVLAADLATAAVIWVVATSPYGWTARILSWQPLAWLGRISYSLYLYNVVVRDVLVRRLGESLSVSCLAVAAAVGAAWLSYVAIEKPARAWINGSRGDGVSTGAVENPVAVQVAVNG